MLQGISQAGAQILDPNVILNPLNNYYFTAVSSIVITALGWFITDKIVEPKLVNNKIDGDTTDLPSMEPLSPGESRALKGSLAAMVLAIIAFVFILMPADSAWRDSSGSLFGGAAPLMKSIVPLIFLFFLIPGLVYGLMSGTVKSSRDFIQGMTKAMNGMGYYLVIMFFIAQFIYAFAQSNLGVLLAVEGAAALKAMALPAGVTIAGIILLTGFINLFVGSASAKWALLAPIFIPMLMQLGISPDLAQAAYRIGDSSTNIITPLMPYFPLVVVYCQRYVTNAGIGTLTAMMLPFSVSFLVLWTLFLMAYWALGLPLGIQANYIYPAG
jgi:aminobenzoyl-glutamate transport protein